MINCVVLERSTFWQTIGLLKPEMDTPCSPRLPSYPRESNRPGTAVLTRACAVGWCYHWVITQASTTSVTRVTSEKCRYISMKKLFAIVAVFVAVGAGATAHHLYKKHLRSGHAPLIKAIPPSSHHEKSAVDIHDARVPVRTEKGQQSETRLEPTVAACPEPHVPARQDTFAWKSSNNEAMEEVLHQRQAEAFHAQAGCQAYN
jgi:hypothetical protein